MQTIIPSALPGLCSPPASSELYSPPASLKLCLPSQSFWLPKHLFHHFLSIQVSLLLAISWFLLFPWTWQDMNLPWLKDVPLTLLRMVICWGQTHRLTTAIIGSYLCVVARMWSQTGGLWSERYARSWRNLICCYLILVRTSRSVYSRGITKKSELSGTNRGISGINLAKDEKRRQIPRSYFFKTLSRSLANLTIGDIGNERSKILPQYDRALTLQERDINVRNQL